jgi:hypothetical protein
MDYSPAPLARPPLPRGESVRAFGLAQRRRHLPHRQIYGRAVIDAATAPASSATERHRRDQDRVVGNG